MNSHSISRFPRKLKTPKGTCLLTPHGGFFDGRLHSEPMEPSVQTLPDSDRREPPNGASGRGTPENLTFAGARPNAPPGEPVYRWESVRTQTLGAAPFIGNMPATNLEEW